MKIEKTVRAESPPTPNTPTTEAPSTRRDRKSRALKVFWSGNVMGLPDTSPWSLPNATTLPENVTVPMRQEMAMVNPSPRARAEPDDWTRNNSAAATRAEAPPPNPLKMPTSWGMSVIFTVRAATPPMSEPNTIPATMPVQLTTWFSISVATMAMSMAKAAKRFPRAPWRGTGGV